jgi:hypothetical protein
MSKALKSSAERRRFWQQLFTSWRKSDLTVQAFCETQGVSEASFYTWRKKLSFASGRNRKSTATTSRGFRTKASSPDFIEVTLPGHSSGHLELRLPTGGTLSFPPEIERQSLHEILTVFQELKLC